MSPARSAFEGVTLHNSFDAQPPVGHKFWSNVAKLRGGWEAPEFTLLAFRVTFSHGSTLNSIFKKKKNLLSSLIHFQDWNMSVSKHEQLQKIINLWPIWEREWGCQLSEMYAFSIWHFLMPASFFHRTVKLPFLLVLIERPPPLSAHTIMYCSSIIVCWEPVWLSFPLTLREHFILFVCSLTWEWCTRPGWPFRSWVPFKNSLLYHLVLPGAVAL